MYVVSSLVFYTELASSSVVDGAWFRESVSRVELLIMELSSQILMLLAYMATSCGHFSRLFGGECKW